ncbi:squalene--hopene cyclase [Gloeocapsa sp. PCC 73106]|uniref:squalene--hopene cyclase n=1 Tax=Gloeocapsa sp. PCC 73106 TaxID=102232 RepID=UPI0002AB9A5F|nr:squalene--hopene cyclase [Gloeocapsa sp. PCC 73106]ELS00147.1 squalene-hopene cyclase [Gloeocapsa sp. PCC 73106]
MQDKTTKTLLDCLSSSQAYLLSLQKPEGYWWAELESNVTMTAEAILLHKIWGNDKTRSLSKAELYLRSQQREHGGWELYFGDGGDLSTSVEAYMALRLLNVPPEDPALLQAKQFILSRGGITKTRIFTKLHLALIGCYDWRGIPSIPPAIMLLPSVKLELPNLFGSEPLFSGYTLSIYEMSSWARSSTVPLLIVFDRRPVFRVDPQINLDELYSEGVNQAKYELPRNGDWSDIFVTLDGIFKVAQDWKLMPWREEGLKAAEKWILERQEASGDWGGIIPAMLNSMLALKCLDYDVADPVVERGFQALDRFAIETETTYRMQACVSPVWDTALAVRSLIDAGISPNHPALVKAGEWLLSKQILDYGDWAVKNTEGKPGGWAFEFENRFYPDVDDTAVVIMALAAIQTNNEPLKQQAIKRGVDWISTMQCKPGGWAAFDVDNDQDWLNMIPYGDLKAMIDPNTADVTARVLEMLGKLEQTDLQPDLWASLTSERIEKAIAYLIREQEADGSWFGRWGVNYIYGTSGVLSALAFVAGKNYKSSIQRGAQWLIQHQNSDGGWGETCESYKDKSLKGKGQSTASQTAWALIGLLAVGEATEEYAWESIDKGIEFLRNTQKTDGSWKEDYFTGTGFPGHFYIRYHLYYQHFPLTALGRYQVALKQRTELNLPLNLKEYARKELEIES